MNALRKILVKFPSKVYTKKVYNLTFGQVKLEIIENDRAMRKQHYFFIFGFFL